MGPSDFQGEPVTAITLVYSAWDRSGSNGTDNETKEQSYDNILRHIHMIGKFAIYLRGLEDSDALERNCLITERLSRRANYEAGNNMRVNGEDRKSSGTDRTD